jgi:hypothetical protein
MGKGKAKKEAWTGGHKKGPVLGRDYFLSGPGGFLFYACCQQRETDADKVMCILGKN